MHTHRRLFSYAAGVPAYFSVSALLSLLLTVVIIVQMFSLSLIVAGVFIDRETPGFGSLAVFLLSIIVRSILVWLRERAARQKSVQIRTKIRQEVFGQLLALGPVYSRSAKTGANINLLTEGTEKLDDYFTYYIPSLIHIAILPVVVILFVFYLDWISAVILLVTGPLIMFFMWLIGTYARKISQDQWKSFNRLSARFLDSIQGLKTLKLFGVSDKETENISESSNKFRIITMRLLRVAFLSGMVLELAASISIALVALQVGIRLIEGMMLFQPGLFVLLLAPEFYLPFRALGQHHHAGMEGAASASELFQMLDLPTPSSINQKTIKLNQEGVEIHCRDLIFSYPEQKEPAIQELSCSFAPGTLTAIVGPSGSGKTTFVHLLLDYIRPDGGTIEINGTSLHGSDTANWRQHIAYVSQHPFFFNGTVLENLLMANQGSNMEDVIEAATNAGADPFIREMPQGYDTPLQDNASRLSGGERQRLALARALLRKAPLMILDEPTSYLDPVTEQVITGSGIRANSNQTTIVIAHRLKTVRKADKILVFDKGSIAESGNHDELIAKRGKYNQMFTTLGFPGEENPGKENNTGS